MPENYYVYTVIFSRTPLGDTRFIGFQKKAERYFSYASTRGNIAPTGQPLASAGKFVLPGGVFEGGDWSVDTDVLGQCQNTLARVCGRQLRFLSTDEIVAGGVDSSDEVVPANSYLNRWSSNGFAAMYVQVTDSALQSIADYIRECLNQAGKAEEAIINQDLLASDYDKIADIFPLAPLNDDIALTQQPVWVIKQGQFNTSTDIQSLLNDSDTERFAEIIQGLEIIGS